MEAAALFLAAVDPSTFVPVLARVGGVVSFFPLLGAEGVPARFRLVLAVALAWMLRPFVAVPPLDASAGLVGGAARVAVELLAGCILGFAAQVAVAAFESAGQIVGFQIGMTLSGVIDPINGEQTSSLSTFYRYIAYVLYFSADAHHAFLLALRDSYGWIGTLVAPGAAFADTATRISGGLFPLAIRIAGPALVVSLLIDVAMLLAARALPQVNLLILGYPVKVGLGLLAVAAGLVVLPRIAGESLARAMVQAQELATTFAGGR